MTVKNKKQFGVWMDTHHASIVGRTGDDVQAFVLLGHVKNQGPGSNSNENAANNLEQALMHKFFKQISSYMQNAEEVHVTGTGTVQEQFKKYMAETPQFKNTVVQESTSNKMSDERLMEFINQKFS
ncbi:MAG: hypothetical protein ABIQ74_07070 [Chitinophagales bacterium]